MNEKINPHFYHFLAEGNILCNVTAGNSRQVIEQLADRLCKNTAGLNKQKIIDAVIAREEIVPTVIASGLAVPHARMQEVDRLLVALAVSPSGINFNCPGMPPVKVAVMILTPKDDPGLHLQVLAALAKDFKDEDTIEKVAALKDTRAIMEFFNCANLEIPDYLKARDLMNRKPVTLQESDTLHSVIETFAKRNVQEVPVLDNEGDLRGVVALEDILKFSLPEHILWMDDLTPIYRFQPFADMLKSDHETNLADFMREDMVTVDEEIPAVQLAKLFLVHKIKQIIVTRKGKLAGTITLKSFISKLFWE
ncbi:PTS sugar transporter subunit IIA [Lentisphaerota bacterium ZTH]|nr:PTS sugar transporter subunit IIA [Lentisphaerota bacterium]WET07154.1 PTS sugar transporter subunit IIA [Lentisphaerota bacterium ZTH]